MKRARFRKSRRPLNEDDLPSLVALLVVRDALAAVRDVGQLVGRLAHEVHKLEHKRCADDQISLQDIRATINGPYDDLIVGIVHGRVQDNQTVAERAHRDALEAVRQGATYWPFKP